MDDTVQVCERSEKPAQLPIQIIRGDIDPVLRMWVSQLVKKWIPVAEGLGISGNIETHEYKHTETHTTA